MDKLKEYDLAMRETGLRLDAIEAKLQALVELPQLASLTEQFGDIDALFKYQLTETTWTWANAQYPLPIAVAEELSSYPEDLEYILGPLLTDSNERLDMSTYGCYSPDISRSPDVAVHYTWTGTVGDWNGSELYMQTGPNVSYHRRIPSYDKDIVVDPSVAHRSLCRWHMFQWALQSFPDLMNKRHRSELGMIYPLMDWTYLMEWHSQALEVLPIMWENQPEDRDRMFVRMEDGSQDVVLKYHPDFDHLVIKCQGKEFNWTYAIGLIKHRGESSYRIKHSNFDLWNGWSLAEVSSIVQLMHSIVTVDVVDTAE